MSRFQAYPPALREVLEIFAENPADRNTMLIDYSDQFVSVPERIATRPFPESQRVPHCESESFVFVEALSKDEDPTLRFHFAVENPFGVSARALCAIFDQTLNGQGLRASQIAALPIDDVVPTFFGANVSMGKGQGLTGIAAVMKTLARRYAGAPRQGAPSKGA
ncbi:MAG: SufE family protein [Thermoflexales bacterium]|nr:SufE family protein [Thermoflexales bacterium]